MTKKKLYKWQDAVLDIIFKQLVPAFTETALVLAGGTALSRFYLKHRVSYDLDFFLSKPFDPALLVYRLQQFGLSIEISGTESGGMFATQLHGNLTFPQGNIKVSFVEDIFYEMFAIKDFKGIKVETLDGLFHRKLRTVAGTGISQSLAGHTLGVGQRQKARDLFDLYILDTTQEKICSFITRINANGAQFPTDIFRQNLSAISWIDLMDEADLIEVLAPFQRTSAMSLKRHFDEILNELKQC